MALSRELLAQAKHLATKERRRPRQASLRRAVSTAYYALFHHLVELSSRLVVSGNSTTRRALRAQLARGFDHSVMKNASKAFAGAGKSPWVDVARPAPPVLVDVANSFVDLQEKRHAADYDIGSRVTRAEALAAVHRVKRAMADLQSIRDDPATEAYLLALLVRTRS